MYWGTPTLEWVIPPKTIVFSKVSQSDIVAILWFPSLNNLYDVGVYFTLTQAFWSRRKRWISSKNGVLKFLQTSSFLPPTIKRAWLRGKNVMVWPTLPHGGVPCCLIFYHSADITFPSIQWGLRYFNLVNNSPFEFLPPKK